MNLSRQTLLASMCLLIVLPAFTAGAASPKNKGPAHGSTGSPLPAAERYARRCQHRAPSRDFSNQGTLLWGTKQTWDGSPAADERRSVLASVNLSPLPQVSGAPKALKLEGGHLVVSADAAPEKGAPAQARSLIGTVFQGATSDGKSVEVALCDAEPSPDDPGMVWYHIEAWNPVTQDWENPCVATTNVPAPRALAVGGVWDESGAHHDVAGKLTFACETGVISKCARWGYKPWASREGQSLADLHQACTRMARADYCGDGRSHTHENTMIDFYDAAGVSTRTTEVSAAWDPARGSFEAAWAPDGATCLGHTRDGRPLETLLKECPGRFRISAVDLGDGDRCALQHVDAPPGSGLRNRSYGGQKRTAGL